MVILAAGLGVMLAGGLFVLYLVNKGAMFGLKIYRVPPGTDWQTFYRRQLRDGRKTKKSGWIWFLAGAAAILAASVALFVVFLG